MPEARQLGSWNRFAYLQPLIVPSLVFASLVLRLWHVRHGLPDFLEPATPLRLALGLRDAGTGRVDWNPHQFNDPSLAVYLHFFVQQLVYGVGRVAGAWTSYADYVMTFHIDPSPMVVAARLLGVACDALSVVAAMRLGRRFGYAVSVIAGSFVVCAPDLITTSRSVLADTVVLALALWALERMLTWHDRGGAGRFTAAATLTGLATGTRYPAAVLIVPLAWLAWRRGIRGADRGKATRHVVLACSLALVAFVAATPYALLDTASFARDFAFESGSAATVYFGGIDPWSTGSCAARLALNLGGPIVLLVLGSLGFLMFDPARRVTVSALWMALAGFGLPIAFVRPDPEHSMLVVIGIAAVLGAAALRSTVEPFRRSVRRTLLAVLLAATAGPSVLGGFHAAWTGSDTTQLQARRWCERFLRPEDVLVQEVGSARVLSEAQLLKYQSAPEFQHASDDLKSRMNGLPRFQAATLPLPPPGPVTTVLRAPGHPPREVEVFPHAIELNRVFYDPRLFSAADYVMTSGAVRARFESEPNQYPEECALYRLLESTGEAVARFTASGPAEGPDITVYRIGSRYRAAVGSLGPLDALWWTRSIPSGYRALAMRALAPAPPRSESAAAGAAGVDDTRFADTGAAPPGLAFTKLLAPAPGTDTTTARQADSLASPAPALAMESAASSPAIAAGDSAPPWVTSLAPLYDARIRGFSDEMAANLARAGRYEAAARFALATAVMHPEDDEACLAYSACARAAGRHAEALAMIERTRSIHRDQPVSPSLRLEYAQVLDTLGEHDQARRELVALAAIDAPGDPFATEARRLLERR